MILGGRDSCGSQGVMNGYYDTCYNSYHAKIRQLRSVHDFVSHKNPILKVTKDACPLLVRDIDAHFVFIAAERRNGQSTQQTLLGG